MKYIILLILFPFLGMSQNVEIDTTVTTGRFGNADTTWHLRIVKYEGILESTIDTVIYYQDSITNQREYVWEGFVSQNGTGTPGVSLISDTYPSAPSLSYVSTGKIRLTSSSYFLANKNYVIISNQYDGTNYQDIIYWEREDASKINIYTRRAGTLTNDLMAKTYIKIVTLK